MTADRAGMIVRMWRGRTPAAKADAYLKYMEETGVTAYRATPGNRDVRVLRRVEGDVAEFLIVTSWDSLDAIEQFAGPDYREAVYYPRDTEFLLELEPYVAHYDVVLESNGG